MFGPFRRFPFRGLALVAIGFLLASVLAGGASGFSGAAAGLGFALLIPLLVLKMMFVFFVFGSLLRFAGGGWGRGRGPGWGHGGPWPRHGEKYSSERQDRWFDGERQEWEESLRQAREEVREYDNPFSRPPRGFEPPTESSED